MESSGPSANSSDPNPHRWAEILGTLIALLTLTLPLYVIAHYSSGSSADILQQTSYSLPRSKKWTGNSDVTKDKELSSLRGMLKALSLATLINA